ncbi:transcriptional regulator with HTH domain and aminotransferase domain [Halovivax ruber XH-70]|uniref:Transcriptional regulator with HTH domain and aminotransferase domain n=1 Tax=Halovivax ruber (strain DSM 18193 / JCM 13892 / XH-70) TaxID=797302 RepID=L0IDZ7_HALRX|nr:PLP-dependent aminotransferase family protein [Halovivax ruber]AGB16436.1 transcriptional regulator with HTH domain and aminotransferase domain [Halovivax ruber XH-70]
MHDEEPAGTDLLTPQARSTLESSGYGSWREIAKADAVSLAFGFPFPESFPTDELAHSVEVVFDAEGPQALQYGGGEYATRLESFVREREAARGIDPVETSVLLTNGATHAIDSICRAFLEPGDVVAVERPTFMGSISVFENFGVEIDGLAVDDEGIDVDALADRLETRRAAGEPTPTLLYTISDFQNPTGATLSLDRRKRLLALADEYDFVIVEDGAYTDLRFDGESVPPLAALDDSGRVIRVGSFAKTIAPGVRLGWLVAPEPIRDAIDALAAGGTNTFTRSVVGHYCDAGHFDDLLPALREAYATRRDRLLDALERHLPPEATWTEPDGGFFVWIELADTVDTDELLDDAIDAGVTYLPGSMFYPDDGGTNALRLSFSYADPDDFDGAIASLADVAADQS